MKTTNKKITKLNLKKQTITALNSTAMNQINGGMEDGPTLPFSLSTIICGIRVSVR